MAAPDDDRHDLSFPSERELEQLCDEFEERWRRHGAASIQEILKKATDHHAELFRKLLEIDLEYCQRNGKLFDQDTYIAAFPKYGEIISEVFATIPRQQRSHENARTEKNESQTEGPGALIGPYKILQQIGEGGFGVVYMAEQIKPLKQRVALKIIKPGMDTREVVARFEAERQALALMDHPNIAKVLNAGTTQKGRPYFVMELVRGIAITEYCDTQQIPVRQRLTLFMSVCRAVQHAHQKGIIHRDIKPSNVMITLHDGEPLPKVIDFGIAKAISQQLTEKTLFTRYGQFIGTPQYMSPEQSQLSGLDIDTRSDIYSLGALLYELLTGSPPFAPERLRSAGFDEVVRIIREEEPLKPSQRLSTSDALPVVAAKRLSEPKRLSALVRGDLDWIVMKALEKDRSRRYDTAHDFARDLERFVADKPVNARPPSLRYRAHKFARRNKAAIAMAAVVAAALVFGLLGTTLQMVRAVQAERQADKNVLRARQAVDEYLTLVSESTLLREEGMLPFRKQLLESAKSYYEDFVEQQGGDTALPAELAATHARIALTELAMRDSNWIHSYRTILDILERLQHRDLSAAEWSAYADGTFVLEEVVELKAGDRDETVKTFGRGIATFGRLAESHPSVHGFKHDLAACHYMAGFILGRSEKTRELAISHLENAQTIWETLVRTQGPKAEYASALADVYRSLSTRMSKAGRAEESRQIRRGALAFIREAFGPRHSAVVELLRLESTIDQKERENQLREAISICEEIWEEEGSTPRSFPELRWNWGDVRRILGRMLRRQGRYEEAEQQIKLAIDIHQSLANQNPSNPEYPRSVANERRELAIIFREQDLDDQATAELTRARRIQEEMVAEHPEDEQFLAGLARTYLDLVSLFRHVGNHEEAEQVEKSFQSLRLSAESQGWTDVVTEAIHESWHSLQREGKWQAALEEIKLGLELAPDDAHLLAHVAQNLRVLGQVDAALKSITRAIDLNAEDFMYLERAGLYTRMGRREEAVADLDRMEEVEEWMRIRRANLWIVLDKKAEAAADLAKLKDMEDRTYLSRARLYLQLGEPEKAAADLEQIEASEDWMYISRARLYAEMGKSDEAAADLERIDKMDDRMYLSRARLYADMGRSEQAVADLDRIADMKIGCTSSVQRYSSPSAKSKRPAQI